jgi:acyl carrier protein
MPGLSEEAVAAALRGFFVREVLDGDDSVLDEDTSLMTSGIMDSRTLLQLLAFVEESYGLEISFADLNPDNLKTIRSIARLIVTSTSNKQ